MATTNEPLADAPDKPVPPPQQDGNPPRHRPGHSPAYWIAFAVAVLVAAAAVYFFGWVPRQKERQEIDKQAVAEEHALPRVRVVNVQRAPAESELLVPGTTQAYTEANIYARASGYLAKRLVDIGDHVHAGQLLAVIDAPDLDRQVAQARSTLRQSEANLGQMEAQLHLQSLNWERYKVLVAKGVFSRQDGDTQEANYRVSAANVRAAENTVQANRDNLDRLVVLQGYERVTAPFDGVVTARNIDIGTLITAQGTGVSATSSALPGTTQAGVEANNAGSSGTVSAATMPATGGPVGGALFTIGDTDVFRVLVSVPEAYTSVVRPGQSAVLFFQEVPGEKFIGRVTRTSASIDQNTRTLLVEVQVHNHRGELLPGMYAQVNLVQSKTVPPVLIPGEAIVVRNGQSMVAVVDHDTVHFQPISIGRDYGDKTEITRGLQPGQEIALNVSDEVSEGAKVEPQLTPESAQPPGGQTDKKPSIEGQYGNQNQSNAGGRSAAGGKSKPGGSQGAQGHNQ